MIRYKTRTPQRGIYVGDWVRFLKGDRIVIASVEALADPTPCGHQVLITDRGVTDERNVLEVRSTFNQ